MASIILSKLDFSSVGGTGKEGYDPNWGIKIVDKVVENLTRGGESP